jgi:Pyruvate/2-oxoacid:ferredoxin oxidoreductase delta subunit
MGDNEATCAVCGTTVPEDEIIKANYVIEGIEQDECIGCALLYPDEMEDMGN